MFMYLRADIDAPKRVKNRLREHIEIETDEVDEESMICPNGCGKDMNECVCENEDWRKYLS